MLNRKDVKTALLALAIASPIGASGAGFENIYVVGDSLSDQGNLFIEIGVPGDPYWQGRFADGEVYTDALAETLGINLTPSSLGGNNFADGGARTDYHVVEDDNVKPFPVNYLGQGGSLDEDQYPWTLNAQVETFVLRGEKTGPDALYVVFAGANDLSDLITMVALCSPGTVFEVFCQGRGNPAETIPVVVSGINNAIAAFVEAGARYILVPNMPNLGVIPAATETDAIIPGFSDLATSLSSSYNEAFEGMLAGWEASGVNIIRFDTYSLITSVVATPEAFGFLNAAEPCFTGFVGEPGVVCNDPDSYVFWDKEHPTAAFHAFLAEQIADQIKLPIVLADLDKQVSELNTKKGVKVSLNDKLDGAWKLIADVNSANDHAAVSKLKEFIKLVKARQGKQITEENAASLIELAMQALALLEA